MAANLSSAAGGLPPQQQDAEHDKGDSSVPTLNGDELKDAEKAPAPEAPKDNPVEETDPNIVDWDGPDDPANPKTGNRNESVKT